MNKLFEIKQEFKSTVIGYNNSGLPLGERDDLDLLAEMAITANIALVKFFVKLPSMEEIKKYREGRFLEGNPVASPVQEVQTENIRKPEEEDPQ